MARGSGRRGAHGDKGEGVLPVKGEGARKDPTRINVFKTKQAKLAPLNPS